MPPRYAFIIKTTKISTLNLNDPKYMQYYKLYYIISMIAMVGVLMNIIGIIMNYNLLATRPLPQFEMYRGGDDRA